MQDVHRALWSSYVGASSKRGRPGGPVMSISESAAELGRHSANVPKPILTLGALRLLSVVEEEANRRNDRELTAPPDLDELLQLLTGSTAKEIHEAYGDSDDRFLVLAELYGLLDYQESVRTPLLEKAGDFLTEFATPRGMEQRTEDPDQTIVGARLELCVQMDLETTSEVVYPATWFRSCGLFWDHPGIETTGQMTVNGILRLPGLDQAAIDVKIDMVPMEDDLGVTNRYNIREGQTTLCAGFLEVKKEPGRPGASRITHEKRARFPPGLLRDAGVRTLQYWTQAETLCLLLPP